MLREHLPFVFTLCITFAAHRLAQDVQPETKLRKYLLDHARYDPNVRPITYHSNMTDLHVAVAILDMIEMVDIKQSAKVHVLTTMTWKDELLTWDPSGYNGTMRLYLPAGSIWVPDTCIDIIKGQDLGVQTTIRVTSTGSATVTMPRTVVATCDSNVNGFWSISHECAFMFECGWSSFDRINLDGAAVTSEFLRTHSSWKTSPVTFSKLDMDSSVILMFTFSMERKKSTSTSYVTATSVILTLVMFWLPPTSGRKVTLGCVTLFMLVFMVIELSYQFQGAAVVPKVVVFLSHSTIIVAVALVCSVFILRLAGGPQGCRAPPMLLNLVEGLPGRLLCVSLQSERRTSDSEQLADDTPPPMKQEARRQREWYAVAQVIDRALFFAFVASFVIVGASS